MDWKSFLHDLKLKSFSKDRDLDFVCDHLRLYKERLESVALPTLGDPRRKVNRRALENVFEIDKYVSKSDARGISITLLLTPKHS
jgi:hypothetical protein